MSQLTFGSLFAGVGGFDLGFERAGMTCKWQVEINEHCSGILARDWPEAEQGRDVRTWTGEPVDVICGGFPCQDISSAGRKAGIGGEKSGLWAEYFRIIRELRPRIVVVENVSAILSRGLGVVLADLAGIGFDAGWKTFCSSEFGLPFMRRRVFVVAGTHGERKSIESIHAKVAGVPKASRHDWERRLRELSRNPRGNDGVPDRSHRIKAIGNAVSPVITEWIGRQIVAAN